MPISIEIAFGGEQLLLQADRTLYWPSKQILFATDLHAGKAAHMRTYGLAVPGGNLQSDLHLIQRSAARCGAKRLLFLGDLLHSEVNNEWDIFAAWCLRQPYAVELVRGNHDRFLSDLQLSDAGITVYNEPRVEGPFELRHHPVAVSDSAADKPVICGHLHPVFWTRGVADDRLRLPCFWQQPNQLILPAVGSATGGLVSKPADHDKIYVCASDNSTIVRVY